MTAQDLTTVRNFFSDDEWNTIESALSVYADICADYGADESDLVTTVQSKIATLLRG